MNNNVIKCLSRKAITEMIQDHPVDLLQDYNVVSMLDSGMASPFITSVYNSSHPARVPFSRDLLTLNVDDIEQPGDAWFQEFTASHARRLHLFIRQADLRKPFLTHCFKGSSRSGAVGLYLTRYFGKDEPTFWSHNPQVKPNLHILGILEEVGKLYPSRMTTDTVR